jgi:dTDP-4-dehydrorhamnose reductase
MSWLVVGARGQLGTALERVLNERGISYRATNSNELDIRSALVTSKYIDELNPSVIVNAAAWTDVDGAESNPAGAHAVNVDGALNLALAAKAAGAIFVHISTDYVFSGVGSSPWKENDERSPASSYGKSKAGGEVAVLAEYPQRTYIFRTAWLYSPWGKNFAKTMARLALSGDGEVKVVDDQIGQPTSALDLAHQIIGAVLGELPFGVYHATNSGQASWFEFAKEIFSQCGASANRVVATDSSTFIRPAKRPAYSVLGHGAWENNGSSVGAMRDWQLALKDLMPEILSTVRAEG